MCTIQDDEFAIPEWFDSTQTRDGDGYCLGGLRPSEVVRQTSPDPAEQAPLVARSVTPPSPSGRGGTTLLRQRAPRSCTVFVMTPPNEHTSEGGRDDRGVPYHAESALSSAQVLKCAVGLARASAKRVSLPLGCVTGFHSENRRFRSARGGSREKEGERLIEGLTARTPTEGGVGRHTSRRRESDRPEGGSGPPRGQTTDRRGGPHELGGVGTNDAYIRARQMRICTWRRSC